MRLEFASIASGSSGNCIYVASKHTRLLIDAGLSGKRIEAGLSELALTGNDIDAMLVTHEHNDHVDGLGVMSRRFDIPVYATEGTWRKMPDKVGRIKPTHQNAVYSGENLIINDLCIKPFDIPHDAAQPVGYCITDGKCKITIATDIGHITDEVKESVKDSDLLLIESNHDVEMVKTGPYPYNLKQRVLGDFGHLSNENCGKMLEEVISSSVKYVFLGHLSNENNTPTLAFETVKKRLEQNGAVVGGDFNMYVAPRYGVKRRISLT
jgi:phosphoribosyl 1,2-cyclic phosphodiesterase